MALKSKSFEGSAARRRRYEREARDLKRDIDKLSRSIQGFQQEIDEQPAAYAKLKAYYEERLKKAKDAGERADIQFQADKDLANYGPGTVETAKQAIAQFKEKMRPFVKRLDTISRWLDKH